MLPRNILKFFQPLLQSGDPHGCPGQGQGRGRGNGWRVAAERDSLGTSGWQTGLEKREGGNVAQTSLSPQAKPGSPYNSHSTVLKIIHLFDDYLMNGFMTYHTVGGLTMPISPPKDVHVLISGTCGCATLHGKRDFEDVIKPGVWRRGGCPDHLGRHNEIERCQCR